MFKNYLKIGIRNLLIHKKAERPNGIPALKYVFLEKLIIAKKFLKTNGALG